MMVISIDPSANAVVETAIFSWCNSNAGTYGREWDFQYNRATNKNDFYFRNGEIASLFALRWR